MSKLPGLALLQEDFTPDPSQAIPGWISWSGAGQLLTRQTSVRILR